MRAWVCFFSFFIHYFFLLLLLLLWWMLLFMKCMFSYYFSNISNIRWRKNPRKTILKIQNTEFFVHFIEFIYTYKEATQKSTRIPSLSVYSFLYIWFIGGKNQHFTHWLHHADLLIKLKFINGTTAITVFSSHFFFSSHTYIRIISLSLPNQRTKCDGGWFLGKRVVPPRNECAYVFSLKTFIRQRWQTIWKWQKVTCNKWDLTALLYCTISEWMLAWSLLLFVLGSTFGRFFNNNKKRRRIRLLCWTSTKVLFDKLTIDLTKSQPTPLSIQCNVSLKNDYKRCSTHYEWGYQVEKT